MSNNNNEFVKSLELATVKIINNVSKNMNKACLTIVRDAKANCPVDMGMLRASINSEVSVNYKEITGYVGSNLEYAPYVHQGTGVYAIDGNGRKTPWKYTVKSGKYKGTHITIGQRPKQFLEKAKIKNRDKILIILSED